LREARNPNRIEEGKRTKEKIQELMMKILS
jgi:hypothetical protein